MLLTRVGFRDKKGRFLPADSLKMESMNTDSTVKEGPRKDSRVERSGSSELWQGKLSDLGRGVVVRCPFRLVLLGWYSLGVGWERTAALVGATAGEGSTDTGCRLSLESRSWMLVRRVVPSAVEMTLLARGSVEEAESRRSETDVALPCEDRLERIGTEPFTRVLSALRRVGRPGCPADLGGRSELTAAVFPLDERNMPRPFVEVRSFCTCSLEVERRGESTVRFSWLPDSAGSIPSSRNCCRESTSVAGDPVFLIWVCAELPAAVDGSRDLRSCRGLWWDEREDVGCWTGLLPLLDHTSWSKLRLNSPLLSL